MSTALARKFRVDVTTDLTLAGGWIELAAINDFSHNATPNLEDASAYDTDGYASFEKTFEEWVARATFSRRMTGGVYDAGQELVRARSIGQWGDNARVGVRFYDRFGGPEAYKGVALVGWERAQTGVKNLDAATVTFTGTDVALQPISNPGVAAAVPLIVALDPTSGPAAGGTLVKITGSGFTGVSAVTFDAVAADGFDVASDQLLYAITPAGIAGPADMVITNGVGPSTTGTGKFTYV